MPKLSDRLDTKKEKDLKVLTDFVNIFCRENHAEDEKSVFNLGDERIDLLFAGKRITVCEDCRKLLNHSIAKRLQCRYDPKPMCKKCKTHCYAPVYREKVREVMRFSGLYLVKHGRIDLMIHYFF